MFLEHFTEESVVPQKNTGLYSQQYLSFLMARKCVGENVTLPEHKHVSIMDKGGLWKINENVTSNENCRTLF